MTNNNRPITPPPEMVQQWVDAWYDAKVKHDELVDSIATKAARWGADQELEACVKWSIDNEHPRWAKAVKAARRPKPPSLKDRALHTLRTHGDLSCAEHDTIRRALEQLDD